MAFQIDLSSRVARNQVRQLEASLERLGQKADQAGAKLQSSVGGTGGTRGLRQIVVAIKAVNENLVRMGENWNRSQTKGAVAIDALNKRIHTQRKRFTTARVSSDLYGDSLLSVSQKAAILRSSMLALGTHVGIFSASTLLAATATFGLVKAIKAVVTIGAEFTRSLAHTSAIIGETRDNLGPLTEQMFKLAETTKFTTTQVAEASTVLAKTGLKMKAVGEALPAVLNLAAIGSMDMAKAADIAANSMFGFQLKARDLTMVVDMLAFAATNSNTTVQQLGNALSFAAPVAAATGAKFKDVAGLLAVMANSGVKASRAGTTLRRAFVNLISPSTDAAVVLSDLGVATRDSEGRMRSMVDIMKDFTVAGGNIGDLEEIFGVRALPGMAAIWQDMGKAIAGAGGQLDKFFAEWETKGANSAEKMRDAMELNLIDVWLKFTSVLSVEATRAFFRIEESLKSAVIAMTEFVRGGDELETTLDKVGVQLDRWESKFGKVKTWLNIKPVQDFNSEVKRLGPSVSEIMFPEGMFSDFATNLDFAIRAIRLFTGNMVTMITMGFMKLPARWNKAWTLMGVYMDTVVFRMGESFRETFQGVFEYFADKFRFMATALLLIGASDAASSMLELADSISKVTGSTEASAAALAKQLNASTALITGYEREILMLDQVSAAFAIMHAEKMQGLAEERVAELKAMDASLAHIDRMQRIRERLRRDVKKFHGRDNTEDPERSKGRGILREDTNNIMANSIKDMKEFIKLQKLSTKSTKEQIQTLLVLKEISPFEAFRSNITKAETGIEELVAEYIGLIAILAEFKQQASDTKHFDEAKKFQTQIENVTLAFESQLAVFNSTVTGQTNGLTLLRDKYELVSDSVHGYIVQLKRLKKLSEDQLLDAIDALRGEGMSGADKIREERAEKLSIIEQANNMELTLMEDHFGRMLMGKSEYEDRWRQIQMESGQKLTALWVDTHNSLFDFAESIRAKDKAGQLSNGIAMLDQAGKTSKKAFKLSKAAKIAQAVIAMHTGATEALKWGWPMGPIFAAMIVAQGLQSIQAIRATQFGGGVSGGGGGGGTAAVPTVAAVDVPSQTDALFNQTTSGGVPNTIDSSSGSDALTVNFEINTVDATGISALLERQKPQIVGMIQEAYQERGSSGGPIQ